MNGEENKTVESPESDKDAETSGVPPHVRKIQPCSVTLSFDFVRHFMLIATGGIAFVVGMTQAKSMAPTPFMWWILIFFGLSCIAGFLFFMKGIGVIAKGEHFEVWKPFPRYCALSQMVLCLFGIFLLCFLLASSPPSSETEDEQNGRILVVEQDQKISIPFSKDAITKIEVVGGKVILNHFDNVPLPESEGIKD